MKRACVADKDLLQFDIVTSILRTRIHGMAIVNAAANRIAFDDLNAHFGREEV